MLREWYGVSGARSLIETGDSHEWREAKRRSCVLGGVRRRETGGFQAGRQAFGDACAFASCVPIQGFIGESAGASVEIILVATVVFARLDHSRLGSVGPTSQYGTAILAEPGVWPFSVALLGRHKVVNR